uniref:MHD2 domain-containing protein n=1 Tax=Kalanchoe fedtschenkoi TaxID=63787 RepID=A0A7N0VHE3_KALFE
MQQDLNIFKDFFVADGDGLPRSLVELEARTAMDVLSLFSRQTEYIVHLLMAASENISPRLDFQTKDYMYANDGQTLIRVLCHKKDREASKFLKKQYQLPTSSEYDDRCSKQTNTIGAPYNWSQKGQNGFQSVKKKLQKATYDIRYGGW